MAVQAEDLITYLRNPPDDVSELNNYIRAAKSKARAAGIPDYKHNALYDDMIKALAGMYYDNRSMAFSGSYQATAEETATKLINSYVLSLRHAGEDPEEPEPEGGDDE